MNRGKRESCGNRNIMLERVSRRMDDIRLMKNKFGESGDESGNKGEVDLRGDELRENLSGGETSVFKKEKGALEREVSRK